MKKMLILIIAGILLFTATWAAADDLEDLLRLKNGIKPDSENYEDMSFYINQADSCPEGWEIKDGILYNKTLKTALYISEEAVVDGIVTVAPETRMICADALQVQEPNREIQIRLPDGLKVIGERALTGPLQYCEDGFVQTVHVPASVRLIQEPLGECSMSLVSGKPSFIVDENNPRYTSTSDGLLIDKLEDAVLWCASFPETRTVTVPDGIRRIAPYAFAGCDEIVSVSLPDSLIEIGESAFCLMPGLTEITIPENVLRIGYGNFSLVGRDEFEKWYLSEEGKVVIGLVNEQNGRPELTNKEVLQKFGIDRQEGITFLGSAFILEPLEPTQSYPHDYTLEPCFLPVRCPADAFFLDYLEYFQSKTLPTWQLTIIEPDGSTRTLK